MMKKTGFTLAEVLITLGIIGITAALTLPSLIDMHQDAGVGPKLAKAQNTMEDAIGRYIVDNPDTPLKNVEVGVLSTGLKDYIIGFGEVVKDGSRMELKKDSETSLLPNDNAKAVGNPYAIFNVSINGKKFEEAKCGVDKFSFHVTSRGAVVPYGCTELIANNGWKIPEGYSVKDAKCLGD